MAKHRLNGHDKKLCPKCKQLEKKLIQQGDHFDRHTELLVETYNLVNSMLGRTITQEREHRAAAELLKRIRAEVPMTLAEA